MGELWIKTGCAELVNIFQLNIRDVILLLGIHCFLNCKALFLIPQSGLWGEERNIRPPVWHQDYSLKVFSILHSLVELEETLKNSFQPKIRNNSWGILRDTSHQPFLFQRYLEQFVQFSYGEISRGYLNYLNFLELLLFSYHLLLSPSVSWALPESINQMKWKWGRGRVFLLKEWKKSLPLTMSFNIKIILFIIIIFHSLMMS